MLLICCCHSTVYGSVSSRVCLSLILGLYSNCSLVYNPRVRGSLWGAKAPPMRAISMDGPPSLEHLCATWACQWPLLSTGPGRSLCMFKTCLQRFCEMPDVMILFLPVTASSTGNIWGIAGGNRLPNDINKNLCKGSKLCFMTFKSHWIILLGMMPSVF